MTHRDIPIFARPGSGIWHLRRTIPTSLRKHFPTDDGRFRAELSPVSLRTRDEKVALKGAVIPWAEHRAMLDRLSNERADLGKARKYFRQRFEDEAATEASSMTETLAKIAELEEHIGIRELKAAAHEAGADASLRQAFLRRDKRELVALKEAAVATRHELRDVPVALADPRVAQPVLNEYLDDFVEQEPHAIDAATRALIHQVIRSEALTAYTKIGTAVSDPALSIAANAASGPSLNATDLTPACSVKEYYREHYRKDRKIKAALGEVGISPDGIDKVREGVRDFTDVVGDIHIAAVTSNHVRQLRTMLRRVPASWRKRTANQGKSLGQLVLEADAEEARTGISVRRLHPSTIDGTLGGLSSLFRHACNEGHLATNPARGIGEEIPTERAYDTDMKVEDLNKLFASPWFAGSRDADSLHGLKVAGNVQVRDHRYWSFLCMLFSGARVSEIGGIRTDQVCLLKDPTTDEKWGYFEFAWTYGAEGRRTKNPSSNRAVPIHKELIKLGFIEYVQTIKDAGHERLFPEWKPQRKKIDDELSKNDYSSAPFLKVFNRYVKWLGIKRPGISVKSFRASWETATVGKNIDERALLKITGRALAGELPAYVAGQIEATQLRPSVNQVSYEGLKISHLYAK